jgi:hypothetical protein
MVTTFHSAFGRQSFPTTSLFFRSWIPATNGSGFMALGTEVPSGLTFIRKSQWINFSCIVFQLVGNDYLCRKKTEIYENKRSIESFSGQTFGKKGLERIHYLRRQYPLCLKSFLPSVEEKTFSTRIGTLAASPHREFFPDTTNFSIFEKLSSIRSRSGQYGKQRNTLYHTYLLPVYSRRSASE